MRLKPAKPGPLWRFMSSVWVGIGLMVVCAVMAIIGHAFDIKETEEVYFGSWWFSGLMLVLAANITVATLDRSMLDPPGWFPWRLSQIPWLMVHLGLVTIIIGGSLTKMWRTEGMLYVEEGKSERVMLMHERELVIERNAPDGTRTALTQPIRLNHLKRSDDLSTRIDDVAVIGRIFWTAFAILAGLAAWYFGGQRQAAMVAAFIFGTGVLSEVLIRRTTNLRLEGPDGAVVTVEKYLPHYTTEHRIEADPSGQGPAAMEVEFKADAGGPMARPMTTWVGLDPEAGNVAPVAKEVVVAGQRFRSKDELARVLAGQATLGTLIVAAGGETKRIPLDPLVKVDGPPEGLGLIDQDVQVGGHTLHLKRFLWHLVVDGDKAKDQAPGGPLGPTASVQVDRIKFPDGSEKPLDRFYVFASSQFRGMDLAHGQLPPGRELKVEVRLPTWRVPEGKSINLVVGPGDDEVRLVAAGFGQPLPATADELLALPRLPAEGALVPGAAMPLRVRAKSIHASVHEVDDLVFADPMKVGDADKLPDAAFVRLRTRGGQEASGWLKFNQGASDDLSQKLMLRAGDETWVVDYRSKTKALPFHVHLNKFTIEWAPGMKEQRPLAYQSDVTIKDPEGRSAPFDYSIYMNHTLWHGRWPGYTLFQNSYIKPPGRPPISVFAVQHDPGELFFYLGSISLPLGVLMIFYVKPWLRQVELRRRGQAPAGAKATAAAGPPAPGAVGSPVEAGVQAPADPAKADPPQADAPKAEAPAEAAPAEAAAAPKTADPVG